MLIINLVLGAVTSSSGRSVHALVVSRRIKLLYNVQVQKDSDEVTPKDKTGEDLEAIDELPASDQVSAVVEG